MNQVTNLTDESSASSLGTVWYEPVGISGPYQQGMLCAWHPLRRLVTDFGSATLIGRMPLVRTELAPVAQRIERLTTDQKVWGSNPYGRATLTMVLTRWESCCGSLER